MMRVMLNAGLRSALQTGTLSSDGKQNISETANRHTNLNDTIPQPPTFHYKKKNAFYS